MIKLSEQVNVIYEKIEAAILTDDLALKNELLLILIGELHNISIDVKSDSGFWTILGYAWYQISNHPERESKIENSLLHAIKIDSNNWSAKQYLAYYFFDTKKHTKCWLLLEQLNNHDYPVWLMLKLSELKLVCELHMGIFEIDNAVPFMQKYKDSDEDDKPVISELWDYYGDASDEMPYELKEFTEVWGKYWDL